MPKVTLARRIKIRNHANLSIIDIHDRELRNIVLRSQLRIVKRPDGFVERGVRERLGVGIEVCHEGDEPVFHVGCDGGVVHVCEVLEVSFDGKMLLVGGRWLFTRGVVLCEDECACGAVQLCAGIEDEFICWLADVGHCAGHVIGWAVDDEVAEEILALPESAVVRLQGVEMV